MTRYADNTTVSPLNARLIAELQAVAIGIHLVGLDRLPEVMRPVDQEPAGLMLEGPSRG